MAGFPKNFLWGGASAANQCEGGIFEGGRGLANVDVCPSGADRGAVITGYRKMLQMDEGHHYPAAEAVDFYHRFREDIRLLGGMGLQVYRMSIAWTRIFPKGDEEEPNEEGLRFYEEVFRECRKNGIRPLVTICHFDCPVYLIEKYGGWRNRKMIGFYLRLCRTLFERYKDYVTHWLTFNEINMILHAPFMGAGLCFEEGEDEEAVKYQAAHHELVASALATKLAHEINPANQIGCMFAAGSAYPYSCRPEDVWEALLMNQENYFFVDVQSRGYYPSYAVKRLEKRGVFPQMEPEDVEIFIDWFNCADKELAEFYDFVPFFYVTDEGNLVVGVSLDPKVAALSGRDPSNSTFYTELTAEETEPFRKKSVFWDRYDKSESTGEVLRCREKQDNIWLGDQASVWDYWEEE